jgi:hypothetical protein
VCSAACTRPRKSTTTPLTSGRRVTRQARWQAAGREGGGGEGGGGVYTCKVTLGVKNPNTKPGDRIMVVGSHPALGRWQVQQGVVMETSKDDFPMWRTQV